MKSLIALAAVVLVSMATNEPCMHKRVELKSAQTVKPKETQNVHA